jgi:histidine triad (HIT) family protein
MEPSIFTKIIRGEIPAHKIYEDEKTIAFLDIHGTAPGHTLVVPKVQVDQLWDLDDENYDAVMDTCKKVALHLRKVLGTKRVGIKLIGEQVPHVHVQLIPFTDSDDYSNSPNPNVEPNHEALAKIAEKLRF